MSFNMLPSFDYLPGFSLPNQFSLLAQPNNKNSDGLDNLPGVIDNESQSSYIVQGQEPTPFQYPFIVRLRSPEGNCGGALIANDIVVTAAHCINSPNGHDYRVISNCHNLKDDKELGGEINYLVRGVKRHPQYHTLLHENDIALLHIQPNANRNATTIEYHHWEPKQGTPGKVIGWGQTGYDEPTSDILKELDVEIENPKVCQNIYYPEFYPTQYLCVRPKIPGGSACNGDSGGPLIVDGVLAGIVSFSGQCCKSEASVYIKVSYYVKWIDLTIEEFRKCESVNYHE